MHDMEIDDFTYIKKRISEIETMEKSADNTAHKETQVLIVRRLC